MSAQLALQLAPIVPPPKRELSLIEIVRAAWPIHQNAAREAFTLFSDYCNGRPPPRVPGMDTHLRLAVRIHLGATIEVAAAREYLYRWSLAIDRSRAFGAPHAIGL